ncbi:hypothetical protein PYW08_014541 [Mythimna loreyi]|uniref:Uncharacterized protein n=1 Tax=Mythimna loreyi TaxID=667449 RepID=A0ACC2R2R4_9NEOP|nr:hypothetical protein PYW08_014541 [Mythimna loreyi]
MCRTAHAVLSTVICGIQMLVRVFMTVILMIENVIRMLLQTLYNFISFLLQMISLIPICVVFLLTARLKCFMCGGGGPCPVGARGGTCDCVMSFMAVVIIFFIFRATGVLDKVFYSLGYAKAEPPAFMKFVPTPGEITECSRNESTTVNVTSTMAMSDWIIKYSHLFTKSGEGAKSEEFDEDIEVVSKDPSSSSEEGTGNVPGAAEIVEGGKNTNNSRRGGDDETMDWLWTDMESTTNIGITQSDWTTVLYYLI